jgi:hypothetical protein
MRLMVALLASLRAALMATFASSGAVHAQQPADADDAAWAAAQGTGTAEAYQRYLDQFPVGRHADKAFRRLIEESLGLPDNGGATRGLPGDMY